MAIDANIELAEEEDSFYVFGYLKKLRQSRKGLIENVDQYKFVYDTLEEYIVCGNSFFHVKELSLKLKQKSLKDPATKLNEYQREYAQICKQTPRFSIGDCAGGHRADNREKNRDVLCVPRKGYIHTRELIVNSCIAQYFSLHVLCFSSPSLADNFRPYLTSFQGNAFTDYINAVFVDVSLEGGGRGWANRPSPLARSVKPISKAFTFLFFFLFSIKSHYVFLGLHKAER
jgi:protein tyrosine phosphatase